MAFVRMHRDLAARSDEDHSRHDQCGDPEAGDREQDLEGAHAGLTALIQNAPAARIEGTHRPTNTPSSRLPPNQSPIESRNETQAATRKSVIPMRRLSRPVGVITTDTVAGAAGIAGGRGLSLAGAMVAR
jgi:hypothetical protein